LEDQEIDVLEGEVGLETRRGASLRGGRREEGVSMVSSSDRFAETNKKRRGG